jgi:alpha-glucosidase
MPRVADAPNFGFSSGAPWLPLGPAHKALAVSAQEKDAASPLHFTRALLKARKAHPALRLGDLKLQDAPAPMLAFIRRHESQTILCVFNLGREPASYPVPDGKPLEIGCGNANLSGRNLTLGPLSAWFGIL